MQQCTFLTTRLREYSASLSQPLWGKYAHQSKCSTGRIGNTQRKEGRGRRGNPMLLLSWELFLLGRRILPGGVSRSPSVRIRHPYPFSALMTTISGPRTSSLSFAPRARVTAVFATMHGHMCVWVGGPPVRFSRAFPPHCVTPVNIVWK